MRLLVGIASIAFCPLALAQQHSIGMKLSNLGLGIEYAYRVNELIAVRGSLNGSGYTFDNTQSSVDYEFDIDFDSWSLGVDFHPTRSKLRLSIAAVQNDSRIIATSKPAQFFEIGGTVYPADEVGTVLAGLDFDAFGAYAGIGWDWRRAKTFGVALDLGLLTQDAPTVVMAATGPIFGDPQFAADLTLERQELQDAADDLDLYPVMSLSFLVRF